MCGIAGFSKASSTDVDASALIRLLLAGLAERGEDACGFAWRMPDGTVSVVKRALAPLAFLEQVDIAIPPEATAAIVHVRDHTKGRPSIEGNNHPIVHGRITGVHNGIIQNDDALFARHGRARAVTGMSVDSEALFMLLDVHEDAREAFPELLGSYASTWFDDRQPDTLHVVRGRARPLVLGTGDGLTVFASTNHAISFAAARLDLEVHAHEARTGTLLGLRDGTIASSTRIRVRRFDERSTPAYPQDAATALEARELALRQVFDDVDGIAMIDADGPVDGEPERRRA